MFQNDFGDDDSSMGESEDEEHDLLDSDDESEGEQGSRSHGASATEKDAILREYYEAMERELFGTKVAEGFQRVQQQQPGQEGYIEEVDEEDSDVSQDDDDDNDNDDNDNDDEEDLKPRKKKTNARREFAKVDIQRNLATNMLQSFTSQYGSPGPTSSILGSLGIVLPRDEGDSDSD